MEIAPQIQQKLMEYNEWWVTGRVPEELLKKFHRRDFYVLCEQLKGQKIVSITGLRRVGKSTLLYQLIDYLLLHQKVPPHNILFATLEHPLWKTYGIVIEDIIQIYCTTILNKSLTDLKSAGQIYIFFDEIHYQPNWELYLKTFYDRYPNIKFIISGSSSLHLLRFSAESLVGRIRPQLIFPLKFLEICRYNCFQDTARLQELDQFNFELRTQLKQSITTAQGQMLFEYLTSIPYWQNYRSTFETTFNSYLLKGGFPEHQEQEIRYARQELMNYMDLLLFRDIPQIYPRRNIDEIRKVLFWSVKTTPHRTSYTSIASTLEMKRDTVVTYLNILENVFLINKAEFYTKSAARRLRSSVKLYIQDPGILASYDNYPFQFHQYSPDLIGNLVEGIAANHLRRLKFNLEGGLKSEVFYWTKNRQEVDIVCELLGKPLPIEVKYQKKIDSADLRGVKQFLEMFPEAPFGMILSKQTFELQDNILILPLWLALLVV